MFFPIKDYNPTKRFCWLTILIISVNILVFGFQSYISQAGKNIDRDVLSLDYHIYTRAMIPKEITSFKKLSLVVPVPSRDVFGNVTGYKKMILKRRTNIFLTIIFSLFMHGSLVHLLTNMLFLWIFGNNIEDKLGPFKFLFFYLICGIGASLVHLFFNWSSSVPVIGASGAVSGVMGAYLILFPKAKVKTLVFVLFFITFVDIPAGLFLLIWLVFQFLNIGSASNIAWFAHIGGFITGAILISKLYKKPEITIEDLE